MIGFGESSPFKRAYKHLIKGKPDLEEIFRERLTALANNSFDPILNTHRLSGRLRHQWAFSLKSLFQISQ
jgi:mRNA-degrading endonuclease YafQ of YafQ-DinJ toxin-antitoxin module